MKCSPSLKWNAFRLYLELDLSNFLLERKKKPSYKPRPRKHKDSACDTEIFHASNLKNVISRRHAHIMLA